MMRLEARSRKPEAPALAANYEKSPTPLGGPLRPDVGAGHACERQLGVGSSRGFEARRQAEQAARERRWATAFGMVAGSEARCLILRSRLADQKRLWARTLYGLPRIRMGLVRRHVLLLQNACTAASFQRSCASARVWTCGILPASQCALAQARISLGSAPSSSAGGCWPSARNARSSSGLASWGCSGGER